MTNTKVKTISNKNTVQRTQYSKSHKDINAFVQTNGFLYLLTQTSTNTNPPKNPTYIKNSVLFITPFHIVTASFYLLCFTAEIHGGTTKKYDVI
jgi:hypothetical protein